MVLSSFTSGAKVTISTVKAAANVAYVRGAANLSYIRAQASISLDFNRITQLLADSVTLSDSATISALFNRTISDSITSTDLPALQLAKVITDSVTVTDSVALNVAYIRNFDSPAYSKDTTKWIDEGHPINTMLLNDSSIGGYARLIKNINVSLNKNSTDAITLSDYITLPRAYESSPADSATSSDVLTTGITKSLTDSVIAVDDFAIHETKNHSLVTSATATDSISVSVLSGYAMNGSATVLNTRVLN